MPKNSNIQVFLNFRFLGIVALVLVAAGSRLLPHPPGFSPIAAIALFAGGVVPRKGLSILVALSALLLSDMIIGFHDQMIAVYGSMILISCLGFVLRENRTVLKIGALTLTGSVLFFLITNFSVWAETSWYDKSFAGLMHCYALGIPFLQNSLAGDFLFSATVFGAWAFAERRIPQLRTA